ncbi:translation initiation factor IF-2 associated domain-containing protein [Aquirhabdus sp.]|uniref:translation initiation factor IF-2 associated domain-containing protein n=1 Tax=Aquirhabdus sp. TaxID=2824160 RepID=UPI00396CE409
MADKSVNELAQQVGRPVEKLLSQIVEAGLPARAATALVTENEQEKLVAHLRQSHGQSAPDTTQITLQRKTLGRAKVASSSSKARTINVEVRKKHTFVKPDLAAQAEERAKLELEAKVRIQASIQQKAAEKTNKILSTLRSLNINLRNLYKGSGNLDFKLNSDMDIIELDLHGMGLTDLSEFNKYELDLTHLVKLDLSANSFSKLIINWPMPELQSLNLGGNEIQHLGIIDTGLISWEVIKNLNANTIEELYLERNHLSVFEITTSMPKLRILEIFENRVQLTKVEISVEMKALMLISMRFSQIEEFIISKREYLPCLSSLDLRFNNIKKIGIALDFFDPSKADDYDILLDNNPLSDLLLAALKKESNKERYQALWDLLKSTTIVNRVKLIFIGNTGVGKSTLYKILKKGTSGYIPQKGDSTHGVNIFHYLVKSTMGKGNIEVTGYDFGGQDYYHSIHYSFFGSNALYILLWGAGQYIYHRAHCIRNDKEEISYPLNYWLDSVDYFSKKEYDFEKALNSKPFEENMKNSEIEKIEQKKLNELDRPTEKNNSLSLHLFQNPRKLLDCEADKPFELDIVSLRQKFNFIDKVIQVPPLTNINFSDYHESVKEILDNLIDDYARPEDYPKILNAVEKQLSNKKFISDTDIIIPTARIINFFEKSKKNLDWDGDSEQILEWLDITMSIYWVSPKSLKVKEDLTPEENKQLEDYENIILNTSFKNTVEQDNASFSKKIINKFYYSSPNGVYSDNFQKINPITSFGNILTTTNTKQEKKIIDFEIQNNLDENEKAVKKLKILLREDLNVYDKKLLCEHAVLKLADLTNFIHNILDLECTGHIDLSGMKKGYFTHDSITTGYEKNWDIFKNSHLFSKPDSINFLNEYLDYIIAFMLYNKIAFRAPNPSKDGNILYIAPTYLDESLSSAEEIFLSAFDKPIVEYRFDGFYHVNIFTEVLVKFQKHLSNSQFEQKNDVDYLLWKNKAILFENKKELPESQDRSLADLSSESKQALLYLDFDLGEILENSSDKALDDQIRSKRQPCIRLRTFGHNKKQISESFLRQIINFIDEQLEGYIYEKFALTPNKLDYVNVKAMVDFENHEGKSTGSFTYENRVYRLSDFNLFIKNRSAMKKVFISHSTNDYKELIDFTTYIHPLKLEGLIDHWHCSQLVAGDFWDAEIQKHLWESDIICLLISPSWLANNYTFYNELKTALDRKNNFKMKGQGRDIIILPIIIKPCMWDRVEWLSEIQAAPQKGKPVSSFEDKDIAWNDVAKKLIEAINRIDNPYYVPVIGSRIGKLFASQYEGKLDK